MYHFNWLQMSLSTSLKLDYTGLVTPSPFRQMKSLPNFGSSSVAQKLVAQVLSKPLLTSVPKGLSEFRISNISP